MAAPLPDAGGRIEAAHLFEHEGHEAGDLGAVRLRTVKERDGAAAQLVFGVVAERRRRVAGESGEAGGVEEQAAVAQVLPAGKAVVRRWRKRRGDVGASRQPGLPASRLSVVSIVLACTRVGQRRCVRGGGAKGAARSAADLLRANECAGEIGYEPVSRSLIAAGVWPMRRHLGHRLR